MKKKLLTFALLSTAITTSHTAFAALLGATSGKKLPNVVAPNTSVEITKHKDKEVAVSGAHVRKTSKGHQITPYNKPGGIIELRVNGKKKGSAKIAHSNLRSIPRNIKEGEKVYIHNPGAKINLTQSNRNSERAGHVNITNNYRSGGESFIRISGQNEGEVHLANENNKVVYRMQVIE